MTSTFRVFILLMLSCAYATAQTKFNIKGTVIDGETNESVEGASVQLLSLPDSAFVQGIAADIKMNSRRGYSVEEAEHQRTRVERFSLPLFPSGQGPDPESRDV